MHTTQQKFEETAIIIKQEEIADDIYSMWLHTEQIAAHAKAGQFVSVYCKEGSRLLPRPISICEIDRKDGALRLVYRVAGKGTEEFSSMHTGMQLKVIGPLGNGFPKQEKKAFLIGGGIGIPPMLELAKELNCEKQIVLGYRDELFLLDEFRKQGEVYIATEDGSVGTEGNVLDAIRENGLTADGILRLRTASDAPRFKGVCRKGRHRMLDLHGGAHGVRHRRLPCLRLQVHREGCAFQCEEQESL